jgi:hypothetical protein
VVGEQSPWKTDQEIELKHGFYGLKSGKYKVDIYKVSTTNSHNLPSSVPANAVIEDSWIRNSASNLWEKPDENGYVFPYSKSTLISADKNSAQLEGYYYYFKEKIRTFWSNKDINEWWPSDPTKDEYAMAYTLYLSLSTGINEVLANKWDLKVYPNPSVENLVIEGSWNEDDVVTYKIFDVTGKISGDGWILGKWQKIDVADLSSGIYILSLEVNGEIINEKS